MLLFNFQNPSIYRKNQVSFGQNILCLGSVLVRLCFVGAALLVFVYFMRYNLLARKSQGGYLCIREQKSIATAGIT